MQPLRNATIQELVQAEVTIHRGVFIMITHAQQGEVIAKNGPLHTFSANGPQPGGMVPFPELNNDNASPLLDEMMDYYRAHKATDLGCWSLMPSQAAEILAKHPQEVNRTFGQLQPTLRHTAAERNDTELARLVSATKPDLTIRDKEYDATPPDRAAFFKRSEIIKLIKK